MKRKSALVLGSGGARGWAHVGVIRALLEHNYHPDIIVGCSIGAIVGAFLAAEQFETLLAWLESKPFHAPNGVGILHDFNWEDFKSLCSTSREGGMLKGKAILIALKSLLQECTMETLKTPLAVVATDLWAEKSVTLSAGSLHTALSASFAIPGLFSPVCKGDCYLVDGGMSNPIPVDVARAMGATNILAVDINSPSSKPEPAIKFKPRGVISMCAQAGRMIENKLSELALLQNPPEVLLRPDVGHIHTLDFYGGREGETIGYATAKAALPQIRKVFTLCHT